MFIEFLTSKFFFVVPMIVGAATFLFIMRNMSLGTGISRDEAREQIRNGNMAMAVYFSSRVVAVAIVVGLLCLAGTTV